MMVTTQRRARAPATQSCNSEASAPRLLCALKEAWQGKLQVAGLEAGHPMCLVGGHV